MSHNFTARIGLDKYPVIIGAGVFKELKAVLNTYPDESVLVICDSYFKINADTYDYKLMLIKRYKHIYIDGGIESKGIINYQKVIESLIEYKIKRDGLIVAIGGGVLGDLSGFLASTYQRGIDLIHVPTTTTAMIDSAIGGKTGLNYLGQVNLIGTYYNPKAIFMDLEFLLTLNTRDYYAGICEAIKMSITSDEQMFARFFKLANDINSRKIRALEELVYWSVITKLKYVCDDPSEKSTRIILNYGHTFGQSIETYYGLFQDNLRHGEAIALGITVAAKLSLLIDENHETLNLWQQTNKILNEYNLPNKFSKLKINNLPNLDSLIDNLSNDKKCLSQGNRFVVSDKIGHASSRVITNQNLLRDAFSILY